MKVEEKLWKCVKNNIVGNEICLQRKKTRVNDGIEVNLVSVHESGEVGVFYILLLQFVQLSCIC